MDMKKAEPVCFAFFVLFLAKEKGALPAVWMGVSVVPFYAGLSPVYKTPQGGKMFLLV